MCDVFIPIEEPQYYDLENNYYQKGKGLYQIYQRENRKDKITLIKYSDIPVNNIIQLPL